MIKATKVVIMLSVLVFASVSLSGCTTFDNFAEAFLNKNSKTENTIRIGVHEPVTGADSQQGELEIRGIELANKLYPKALGRDVELVYADNKSDIDVADTVMADLIKKQPTVVLGSYGSIYSLVGNAHLETAKIPGIAITNVNPLVTANHPYYFRVCFVESYQGVALARYAQEQLGEKKTGILIPAEDEREEAMATTYKNKFAALTDDEEAVSVYEQFKKGQKDFTQQLAVIRDSGVKTVFLGGELPDVRRILEQAQKMHINVTFLGDSDWSTEEFLDMVGGHVYANIAFSTLYNENELVTEQAQAFLDAYAEEYGENAVPDAATALGFDAYMIAVDAIEKAGSKNPNPDTVRDMLAQTSDFQGASGVITFDRVGDPMKSVVINTIQDKRVTPICTIDPLEPKAEKETKSKGTKEKEK